MEAEYVVAIISYFDILGFKNLVRDEKNKAEQIREILQLMRVESDPDPENDGRTETEFTAFSDTIVRTTHILNKKNTDYPTGLLFSELYNIAYAQTQMIFKNVLVRGVITAGDIYHKNDIIFGDGLIKAYEMERDISKYPRIIVDPEVLDAHANTPFLKSKDHTHEEDKEYIKGLIRRDNDGVWYISYLDYYFGNIEDPLELLFHHKSLIVRNIAKYDKFCTEYVKYAWLARYHNDFTRDIPEKYFSEFQCCKDDFIIVSDDMPFAYDEGI